MVKSEIRIEKGKEWYAKNGYGRKNYTTDLAVQNVVKLFKAQNIVPVVTETETSFLIEA